MSFDFGPVCCCHFDLFRIIYGEEKEERVAAQSINSEVEHERPK